MRQSFLLILTLFSKLLFSNIHPYLLSFSINLLFTPTTIHNFSFYSRDLGWSTTNLRDTLQQISSWVSADLLSFSLNSSKSEFLLNGLKQSIAKKHSGSLVTSHSAPNLRVIFDKHLLFCPNFLSKLRKSGSLKYPVPYSRTKRYQPFINYALAHFQNRKWISVFYSSFYVVNCVLCNVYFISYVLYCIVGIYCSF